MAFYVVTLFYGLFCRCRGFCHRTESDLFLFLLRSGSQRHRHFVGFFSARPSTDTGPTFLYGDSDTPPQLVAFYDTLGIRRTHSRLNPQALTEDSFSHQTRARCRRAEQSLPYSDVTIYIFAILYLSSMLYVCRK